MQTHTSENTSINSRKLPAIYGKIHSLENRTVIDYGCGRYTDHIRQRAYDLGCPVWRGYDPYNQPQQINRQAERAQADLIICSNVLNVIDNDQAILDAICWMSDHMWSTGLIYCTVYAGKGDGIGRETQSGQSWQRNAPLATYLPYFRACGLKAYIERGMIVAYR